MIRLASQEFHQLGEDLTLGRPRSRLYDIVFSGLRA